LNTGKRGKIKNPNGEGNNKNIKKAKRGEINFQPEFLPDDNDNTCENYRLEIIDERNNLI